MNRLSALLRRRSPVVCILDSGQSVARAIGQMTDRQIGAVLVHEHGRLVGVFSERDVVQRVVAAGRDPQRTRLHDVMTRDVVTATPDEDRHAAIEKMRKAQCRHLPIVVGDEVIDMLSIRDLLFWELEDREAEIDQLREYVRGT
jgi:CBS domain-containing protein